MLKLKKYLETQLIKIISHDVYDLRKNKAKLVFQLMFSFYLCTNIADNITIVTSETFKYTILISKHANQWLNKHLWITVY